MGGSDVIKNLGISWIEKILKSEARLWLVEIFFRKTTELRMGKGIENLNWLKRIRNKSEERKFWMWKWEE